jgi:hypothetical protein
MSTKVTVISTPKNRISINNPQKSEIRTVGIQPNQLLNSLRGLNDVVSTSLDNNETVVYDSSLDKFVVKTLPIINGGTF